MQFISTNGLYNLPINYEYITKYLKTGHTIGVRDTASEDDVIVNGTNAEFRADIYYTRLDNATAIPYENHAIRDTFRLEPRIERNIGAIRYKNYSNTIPYQIAIIDGSFGFTHFGGGNNPNNQTTNLVYAALKRVTDPFPSLDALTYTRISPFTLQTSLDVFGGDTIISSISVFNVPDVVIRRNLFNAINRVTWKGTLAAYMHLETRFNASLNFRTDDYFEASQIYLTPPQPSQTFQSGRDFILNYALDRNTDQDFVLRELGEYIYEFNNDMTVTQRLKEYYPLPPLFDCCSSCTGRSPFRMIYSQQSFQEDAADSFRVFLANNYRDIEGHTGEITDIQRSGQDLLVVTADALWYLPSNVQERVSDAGIVSYLGSGEFFSLPPRLLIEQLGRAQKWATVQTPMGVLLVDALYGRVYMVTNQVAPVAGIESELRAVMGSTLADTFSLPTSYRIGTFAAYDDEYRRVIITHKDYKPLIAVGGTTDGKTGTQADTLYYDTQTASFYVFVTGFGALDVSLNSSQYFCNKSFTVSLSIDQGWVGYHSYTPQIYLAGKKLLMAVNNNHLYKHNVGDYCVYYGTEYPHALEQVFRTNGLDSVSFMTYATENGHQKRWKTWDRAIIYNSYQSTMERGLISKDNIEGEYYLQNSAILSYLLDTYGEMFSINGFRDEVGNYNVPLFITDCVDLSMGNKMLNPLAFTGKEWFEKQPFMDNYVHVRFLFSPHPAVKLATVVFYATDETQGGNRGSGGSKAAKR
jgi:hypothetical protein